MALTGSSKHIIGYATTAILVFIIAWFSCSGIKSKYWQNQLSNRVTQVEILEKKVIQKDIEISRVNGLLEAQKTETAKIQKQLVSTKRAADVVIAQWQKEREEWLAKQPQTPGPSQEVIASLPETPTMDTSDCATAMQELKNTYDTRMEIVVKDLYTTRDYATSVTAEKDLLSQKVGLLETENGGLKLLHDKDKTVLDATKKELDIQTSRKKVYRTTTFTLGGVLLLVLLL